jgi:hypothetical protein
MLWLFASLALADLAPPRNYVESCTLEKRQRAGQECVACRASYMGREQCEPHEAQGFASVCKSRGASVWNEVLCKPKVGGDDESPAVTAEPVVPHAVEPDAEKASGSRCSTLTIATG